MYTRRGIHDLEWSPSLFIRPHYLDVGCQINSRPIDILLVFTFNTLEWAIYRFKKWNILEHYGTFV
jgi:hypothetical protein